MPNGTEADLSVDTLRSKYAELARKYSVLVERLERRASHDLAVYRLGSFGLRITGAALALVAHGRIQMANARFSQLARAIKGELVPVDGKDGARVAGLRTLVVDQATRLIDRGKPALEARYRDSRSDVYVLLRFERNVAAGPSVVSVVAEDISEHARRDQELMQTREPLLQRERLRVLGEMAASIAHDLGNTLRGASFQLAALREGFDSEKKREEAVNAVARRVEIASEAITRMHNFARTGSLAVGTVKLERIVEQAVKLVDVDFRAVASPVHIRVALPPLPPIRGSIAELSLLFVNLLRNARDAMPGGGTVTITGHRNGSQVVVSVADRGIGLTPDISVRLFEPFFTTKGSNGTGLGLWLARGTMERLGGNIRATNRPRGGAIFTLNFPGLDVSPIGPARLSAGRRGAKPRARSAPAPRRTRRGRRT